MSFATLHQIPVVQILHFVYYDENKDRTNENENEMKTKAKANGNICTIDNAYWT